MKYFSIKLFSYGSIILLSIFSYCKKDEATTDAESSASEPYIVDPNMVLPPPAESYTVLGLVNGLKEFVVKYDDKLYRGGEPYSNDAVTQFRNLGITTIITITPSEVGRFRCNLYGFDLVEIPFASNTGPSAVVIKKFLNALNGEGKFYLHAEGGQHRAGIMGLAYRIYVQNWDPEQAVAEFIKLGGNRQEDDAMIQHVLDYRKTWQGEL